MGDVPVRDITEEEIGKFRRDGWVLLRSLLQPAFAKILRDRALNFAESKRNDSDYELFGKEAKVNVKVSVLFSTLFRMSEQDDLFDALIRSPAMARNASRLLRGNPQVRRLVDNVLIKEPLGSSHKHGATDYHQDSATFPFDSTSVVNFWFALDDITADMGTMQFYSRSHELGMLGRSLMRPGDSIPNRAPWLEELEISRPHDMNAGDVTVHHGLTVHGAGANLSDRSRWAYSLVYFDADALYTGAPYHTTDGLGLKVNEPLDHPKFPLVAF